MTTESKNVTANWTVNLQNLKKEKTKIIKVVANNNAAQNNKIQIQ